MQVIEMSPTKPNKPKAVILTETESAASNYHERLLDQGHDTPTATAIMCSIYTDLSDEFIAWQSQ